MLGLSNWDSTTAVAGAGDAFDGDTSSFTKASDGQMLIWRPDGGISDVTLVEAFTEFSDDRLWFNETEVATGTANGFTCLSTQGLLLLSIYR